MCQGAFNVSCLTTKDPQVIMHSLIGLLPQLKVTSEQVGEFSLMCEDSKIKFEIELTLYEYTDFLYVLRFNRIKQDNNNSEANTADQDFRRVSTQILDSLAL